jgi:hypothetical protein
MTLCHSSTPIQCLCGTSKCKGFIAAPRPTAKQLSLVTAESPDSLE